MALTVRDEATMERELSLLQAISDNYPKFLLTLDNDPVVCHEGIKQQYVLDWLLGNEEEFIPAPKSLFYLPKRKPSRNLCRASDATTQR